jgi:hypothetical protein
MYLFLVSPSLTVRTTSVAHEHGGVVQESPLGEVRPTRRPHTK